MSLPAALTCAAGRPLDPAVLGPGALDGPVLCACGLVIGVRRGGVAGELRVRLEAERRVYAHAPAAAPGKETR